MDGLNLHPVCSYDEKLDRMDYLDETSGSDQYYSEDEEDVYPYDEDDELADIFFDNLFGRSYAGRSRFGW